MVRSPGSIRGRVADAQNEGSSSEEASSGSGLRKFLLGLGLAAVAVAVVRKFRSDSRPDDESDEWYQLSIEESADAGEDGTETAGADEENAATAEVEQGASDEKLPDDASRDVGVEADVETEPAEPGEMTVDEEVVEEMTDESDETGASSEAENDEGAAGANDATDDEENEKDEA